MMKLRWYGILLLIQACLAGSLQAQTPSSTIEFEEREHDFGNIREEDGKVSHTFVFKNRGKSPVVITEIYSGCGCIGKTSAQTPINPGGRGEIVITFNPDYKSGFFSKEIVVLSNGGKEYNRIWVKGTVKEMEHPVEDDYPYNFGEGLYLRLRVMAFGYLKPGESKQMELHYANATDQPMEVNFIIPGNRDGLVFTSPGKIGPKARGSMKVFYTMPYFANNDAMFYLYPYVNNKKLSAALEVKVLNEQAGSFY